MTTKLEQRIKELADAHVEQKECTCDEDDYNCAYRDPYHDFARGCRAILSSEEVKGLEKSISGAVDYLKSCGYEKADPSDPEFQMLESLDKALAKFREIGGNHGG